MNADGTGLLRLTNHPALDFGPAWSPDGSRIAFASFRDGNGEIYLMNPDGSDQINLTNHPQGNASEGHIEWSPVGSRIVFRSDRHGNGKIYVMERGRVRGEEADQQYGSRSVPDLVT